MPNKQLFPVGENMAHGFFKKKRKKNYISYSIKSINQFISVCQLLGEIVQNLNILEEGKKGIGIDG